MGNARARSRHLLVAIVVMASVVVGVGSIPASGQGRADGELPGATIVASGPVAGGAFIRWTPPMLASGHTLISYKLSVTQGHVDYETYTIESNRTSTTFAGIANDNPIDLTLVALVHDGSHTVLAKEAVVSVTPRAWSPFASAATAVAKLHQWHLGRAPTATETSTWTGRLTAGSHDMGNLVMALRRSPDNLRHVDPVGRLYQAYFLRSPDIGGTVYWIGRSRAGTDLQTISRGFAASAEFKALYGTLTNRQFVQRIYQNILGRAGEASGVTYWTNELDRGRQTRGRVMIGFSESREYVEAQAPAMDAAFLHLLVLGATPTADQRTSLATVIRGSGLAYGARGILRTDALIARA